MRMTNIGTACILCCCFATHLKNEQIIEASVFVCCYSILMTFHCFVCFVNRVLGFPRDSSLRLRGYLQSSHFTDGWLNRLMCFPGVLQILLAPLIFERGKHCWRWRTRLCTVWLCTQWRAMLV